MLFVKHRFLFDTSSPRLYHDMQIMNKLEDLATNVAIHGIAPDQPTTVISVQCFGSDALVFAYKDPTSKTADHLRRRHDEARQKVVEVGTPLSTDGTNPREAGGYWGY